MRVRSIDFNLYLSGDKGQGKPIGSCDEEGLRALL